MTGAAVRQVITVTEVTTTYFNPISLAARATLSGSISSRGLGAEDSTEQNPQFLVHAEPRIMKAAVGFEKHSPMFRTSRLFADS